MFINHFLFKKEFVCLKADLVFPNVLIALTEIFHFLLQTLPPRYTYLSLKQWCLFTSFEHDCLFRFYICKSIQNDSGLEMEFETEEQVFSPLCSFPIMLVSLALKCFFLNQPDGLRLPQVSPCCWVVKLNTSITWLGTTVWQVKISWTLTHKSVIHFSYMGGLPFEQIQGPNFFNSAV